MLKENNNLYIMGEFEDLTKTLVHIAIVFFMFVIIYNVYLYLIDRIVLVEDPILMVREGFDMQAFTSANASSVKEQANAKKGAVKKKAEQQKKKQEKKDKASGSSGSGGGGGSSSGGDGGAGGSSSGGSGADGSSSGGSGADGSSSGGSGADGSSSGGSGADGSSSGGAGAGAGGGNGSGAGAGAGDNGEGFQGNNPNCITPSQCQVQQTANDNAKLLQTLTQKIDALSARVTTIQSTTTDNAKNKGISSAKNATNSVPNSAAVRGIKKASIKHLNSQT
jgi:hypothetical protein